MVNNSGLGLRTWLNSVATPFGKMTDFRSIFNNNVTRTQLHVNSYIPGASTTNFQARQFNPSAFNPIVEHLGNNGLLNLGQVRAPGNSNIPTASQFTNWGGNPQPQQAVTVPFRMPVYNVPHAPVVPSLPVPTPVVLSTPPATVVNPPVDNNMALILALVLSHSSSSSTTVHDSDHVTHVPGNNVTVQDADTVTHVAGNDTVIQDPDTVTHIPGNNTVVQDPDTVTHIPGNNTVVQDPDTIVHTPGNVVHVQDPDTIVHDAGQVVHVQDPNTIVHDAGQVVHVQDPDTTVHDAGQVVHVQDPDTIVHDAGQVVHVQDPDTIVHDPGQIIHVQDPNTTVHDPGEVVHVQDPNTIVHDPGQVVHIQDPDTTIHDPGQVVHIQDPDTTIHDPGQVVHVQDPDTIVHDPGQVVHVQDPNTIVHDPGQVVHVQDPDTIIHDPGQVIHVQDPDTIIHDGGDTIIIGVGGNDTSNASGDPHFTMLSSLASTVNPDAATNANNYGDYGMNMYYAGDGMDNGGHHTYSDIMGTAGKTYNIINGKQIAVNARFDKFSGSDTATVMGALGIVRGSDQITYDVKAGTPAQLNGQDMETNKLYTLANGDTAQYSGSNLVFKSLEYEITAQDNGDYLDLNVHTTQMGILADGVEEDGIIGGSPYRAYNPNAQTGLNSQGVGALDGPIEDYEMSGLTATTADKHTKFNTTSDHLTLDDVKALFAYKAPLPGPVTTPTGNTTVPAPAPFDWKQYYADNNQMDVWNTMETQGFAPPAADAYTYDNYAYNDYATAPAVADPPPVIFVENPTMEYDPSPYNKYMQDMTLNTQDYTVIPGSFNATT